MKVVHLIKSPILQGLTGCQLLGIISWRLDIERSKLDINDALHGLSKVSTKIIYDIDNITDRIKFISAARLDYEVSEYRIKEKKQKYIRQQHKLAQRHYRRK